MKTIFYASLVLFVSLQTNRTAQAGETQIQMLIEGRAAETVFNFLSGPQVQTTYTEGRVVRSGYAIRCESQVGVERTEYRCFENFSDDLVLIPNTTEVPVDDQPRLRLAFKGETIAQVYQQMRGRFIRTEIDKKIVRIKNRSVLTCSWTGEIPEKQSYECFQQISPAGDLFQDGSDPVIGSGTHPFALTVNADFDSVYFDF